ncbi:MAG TPA: hypothetical protein VNE39_06525 [Planctomycetota bacterium]|nr:hypothetical protein [Planctomycetota bacterium]
MAYDATRTLDWLGEVEAIYQSAAETGDHWTVGFCKPGELDAWRWKK